MINAFGVNPELTTRYEHLIAEQMSKVVYAEGHRKGVPKSLVPNQDHRGDSRRSISQRALTHLQEIAPADLSVSEVSEVLFGSASTRQTRYSTKHALRTLVSREEIKTGFRTQVVAKYWVEGDQ